MRRSQKDELLACIENRYGTKPEYPWGEDFGGLVLRHVSNKKWYGLIMELPRKRLSGETGEEEVSVLNLKCGPILGGSLLKSRGFYPAYHMNKTHWITVILDGTVATEEILQLIEISYDMTKNKS